MIQVKVFQVVMLFSVFRRRQKGPLKQQYPTAVLVGVTTPNTLV
jgi:hypothetical protein